MSFCFIFFSEEIRNKTNIEVVGTNLTITIHANGGDEYPDNAMADYYVVKMVSKCS